MPCTLPVTSRFQAKRTAPRRFGLAKKQRRKSASLPRRWCTTSAGGSSGRRVFARLGSAGASNSALFADAGEGGGAEPQALTAKHANTPSVRKRSRTMGEPACHSIASGRVGPPPKPALGSPSFRHNLCWNSPSSLRKNAQLAGYQCGVGDAHCAARALSSRSPVMEQSFPAIVSVSQPSLGARLTSPESRGAAQEFARLGAGFVLAGLAPSAALLAVTIESPEAAAFVTRGGLTLAGGIGLFQLTSAVRAMLKDLPPESRMKCTALLFGFSLFAIVLAARVWYSLPILQGAA